MVAVITFFTPWTWRGKKATCQLQLRIFLMKTRISLMNQQKILILLNFNSWIHTFLIFYVMKRKLHIKHLKDILKFILRKSVQLFEFWDKLATSFMQHHFYINDQINRHRYLADVFSKVMKWTCHFKKNKSEFCFFLNEWYNLSFHA